MGGWVGGDHPREGQPNLATGQRETYKKLGFLLIFGNMLELLVYIWLFPHKKQNKKNPQNVMTLGHCFPQKIILKSILDFGNNLRTNCFKQL